MGNYFAALPARVPPALLEELRSGAPAALRWLHPADLHLTLAFFGPEDSSRIAAISEVIARISVPEFSVTLGRLLLLPRPNRFTALSFELQEGRDRVAELISTWRGPLLAAAGRPPDQRPPLPHLTIARPSRKHPAFDPREIANWCRSISLPDQPVTILSPVLLGWSEHYQQGDPAGAPRFRALE